ncbi:MAG TPA: universal stress protein [Casimicrobiaceae bacterium]
MARVLIPFTHRAAGERAVRSLLARPRDPSLRVELLAIVDPLMPGNATVLASRERAKAQATAAAQQSLFELGALLDAANITRRLRVATGRLRDIVQSERGRRDIDEVLLGTRARHPLRSVRRRSAAHAMARPLVSVS